MANVDRMYSATMPDKPVAKSASLSILERFEPKDNNLETKKAFSSGVSF